VSLSPCSRRCGKVWYCSRLCERVDYISHKSVCKFHTAGLWTPGGEAGTGVGRRLTGHVNWVEEWYQLPIQLGALSQGGVMSTLSHPPIRYKHGPILYARPHRSIASPRLQASPSTRCVETGRFIRVPSTGSRTISDWAGGCPLWFLICPLSLMVIVVVMYFHGRLRRYEQTL